MNKMYRRDRSYKKCVYFTDFAEKCRFAPVNTQTDMIFFVTVFQ